MATRHPNLFRHAVDPGALPVFRVRPAVLALLFACLTVLRRTAVAGQRYEALKRMGSAGRKKRGVSGDPARQVFEEFFSSRTD